MRIQQVGLGWVRESAGGLERYQDGLCRALAAAGHTVSALVESSKPIGGNEPYRVKAFATSAESRATRHRALRDALRRVESYDLLVTHHASLGPGFLPATGSTPHVVQFHGPWAAEARVEGKPRWFSWLQRRLERRVYRTGDRLITLSSAFANILQRDYGIDRERIRIVPGGVDTAAFNPGATRFEAKDRLGWPTDRPVVLCLRRLTRRMGLFALLDAAKTLRQDRTEFVLLIGGRGPLAGELSERIYRERLEDYVKLLGFINESDLPLAYRAADLSIVPTESLEGFGLIALESLAAGTPAIVTPIGGLPEVVSDLSTSLVADSASPSHLAAALTDVLSGARPLPSGESCQKYVQHRFAWPVIAKQVLNVYEEAIEAHG